MAVLGSWALVARAYAVDGGGGYGGPAGEILFFAVALTIGSAVAIGFAWRDQRAWETFLAFVISGAAALSTLVIIAVIEGRG
jgi:hypothetical protein